MPLGESLQLFQKMLKHGYKSALQKSNIKWHTSRVDKLQQCHVVKEQSEHATMVLQLGAECCATVVHCSNLAMETSFKAQLLNALSAWLHKAHPIHNAFGVHA